MSEIDKAIGLIHKELRHYTGTEDNANITEIITKRSLEYPKELFESPNFYMQRIDNAYDVISYTLNKIYGDKSNNIGLLIHFDPPIQKTSAHSAKFITAAVLSNGDFHES